MKKIAIFLSLIFSVNSIVFANNGIKASVGEVTTFAGSGTQGSSDGTGTEASFNGPFGVAFDGSGNLFVSDVFNNLIRKITPEGVVTTFAGSGERGLTDGIGTEATFRWPSGLAFDGSGNLFVSDYANHAIRKITPSGAVTTFAGNGDPGNADGIGTAARFYSPQGIRFDSKGDLYVADHKNNLIRKITPEGVVTTFAGSGSASSEDGTGTAASFNDPRDLVFDNQGNLFVVSKGGHLIRKITPEGVVTTFAGSGSAGGVDGTGIAATFNKPWSIAIDNDGNMFVAEDGRDGGGGSIRKVTPEAVVTTYAGNGKAGGEDGTGIEASFRPGGIAIDENNDIYVGDYGNNVIRKVSEHQSLLKVPSQYSSITTAIKFALAGDTVLVADGTYTENLSIDKDIVIISENGAEKTIIDGGKITHVIGFPASITRDCVLDGFTVTNGGNANGDSDDGAGGINVWGGSPTLRNLIIKGNRREKWSGGGIHVNENGNPLVEGCTIKENYAESGGGGIDVWRASIKIKDTILENNSAKYTGAMSIGTDDTLDFRPIIDIENVEVINQRDSTIEQMVAFNDCSLTVKNLSFSNIRTEWSLGSFNNSYVNIENLSLKDIRDNGHSLLFIGSKGTVSGLTIERDTSRWAIAKIEQGSKIDFNNLKMSNSKTSDFSGLFIDDATVTIDTLDINNCNWESHSIRVNKSIFTLSNGNISSIISENGNAGIDASESSSVEISNTTINSSSSGAHAMKFINVDKVSITNSSFNGNHSQYSGGVIFAEEIDSLLIENSSFVADTSGGEGGAIQLSSKNKFVRILKSTFSNNLSNSAGAINSWNTDSLFIDNSTFDGNVSSSSGAVSINADGTISAYFEIKNSDFIDNKAGTLGGALWIGNSEGYIQNVGIFNNESVDNFGGGIYISENVELTMNAVTISGNSSPEPAGEGIAIDGGNIIIKNSIIWDNHIQNNSGSIDITYSNIEGGFTGTGNIDANPLFCDYWSGSWPQLAGNYNLTFLSPAIGKGENGVNMGAFDVGCDIDNSLLSVDELIDVTPTEYALHDNYPNPFNPTTTLRFDLPEVSDITLTIYNMLGQKVKTFDYQNTSAGYHSVKWNATNDYGEQVGAGVYLYQLQTKDFVKTRKMVLLK